MAKGKVLIMCDGSRGDCQPYVALARAFIDRGHDVTITANSDMTDFVIRYGVKNFVSFDIRAQENVEKMGGSMNDNYDPESTIPLIVDFMQDQVAQKKVDVEKLIRGNNFSIVLCLQPNLPSKAYPPIIIREDDVERSRFYDLHMYVMKRLFAPSESVYNNWRTELGLPLWTPDNVIDALFYRYGPVAFINGYSDKVVPHPDDYPENSYTLGYWFLDYQKREGWIPDAKLVSFFENCKANNNPPVYFGFGSMMHDEPNKCLEVILETIRNLKLNAVLGEGWGTLKKPQEWDDQQNTNIMFVRDCDHTWLFPQCAAAVIHGGAGTTSTCLLAGIPTIVCPFLYDQPFWGHRVADLGVGPKPYSAIKMTADILTERLRAALENEGIRIKAKEVSEYLKNEDGLNKTVTKIEELLK